MWTSLHNHSAYSHQIWGKALYLNRSNWHLFEIQDGGRRHLGFLSYVLNLSQSECWWLVLKLYTKFGSNIYYSHWYRRTYAPDVNFMTSRKLTSGFDFWSWGHLVWPWRICLRNLVQIALSNSELDIFLKSNMAAAAILDFQDKWIWNIPSS